MYYTHTGQYKKVLSAQPKISARCIYYISREKFYLDKYNSIHCYVA